MGLRWFELLALISALSPILPLFFLLYYNKNIERRHFIFIFSALTLSLLSDIVSSVLAFLFSYSNVVLFHLNTFIMGLIMIYHFSNSKVGSSLQLLNRILVLGLIIFTFIQLFASNWLNGFQLICIYVSFYSVNYSLYSLYKRIDHIERKSELFDIDFWIYCGILIFYGSTFFLTLFESNILRHYPTLFYSIWPIQWVSTILFFTLLTVAVWTTRRT